MANSSVETIWHTGVWAAGPLVATARRTSPHCVRSTYAVSYGECIFDSESVYNLIYTVSTSPSSHFETYHTYLMFCSFWSTLAPWSTARRLLCASAVWCWGAPGARLGHGAWVGGRGAGARRTTHSVLHTISSSPLRQSSLTSDVHVHITLSRHPSSACRLLRMPKARRGSGPCAGVSSPSLPRSSSSPPPRSPLPPPPPAQGC